MPINFSAISTRGALGRFLRWSLRLLPKGRVVPIIQGPLRGKKWIIGSSTHGCWLGSYELPKQMLFQRVVTPDTTVFDIGAHVGYYTILAAELVGANGQVIAVEPLPQNTKFLRQHVELNHYSNVTIVEAAVSNYEGTTQFDDTRSSYTGKIDPKGYLQVRVITLDSLIKSTGCFPQIVKLDIEGAEYEALLGAEYMLTKCRPIVFLATHGSKIHGQCCDLLRQYNYVLDPLPGKGGATCNTSDELLAYPVEFHLDR